MNGQPLTASQAETYVTTRGFFDPEGHAPKYAEAMDLLGISSLRAVAESVEFLAGKGRIKPKANETRRFADSCFCGPQRTRSDRCTRRTRTRACLMLIG